MENGKHGTIIKTGKYEMLQDRTSIPELTPEYVAKNYDTSFHE